MQKNGICNYHTILLQHNSPSYRHNYLTLLTLLAALLVMAFLGLVLSIAIDTSDDIFHVVFFLKSVYVLWLSLLFFSACCRTLALIKLYLTCLGCTILSWRRFFNINIGWRICFSFYVSKPWQKSSMLKVILQWHSLLKNAWGKMCQNCWAMMTCIFWDCQKKYRTVINHLIVTITLNSVKQLDI